MGKTIILGIAVISVVFVMATLVGCATAGTDLSPRQTWCDQNKPRRDATPETPRWVIDEINAHNSIGAERCNWTP